MTPSISGARMALPQPRAVHWLQPLAWLALGWRDMCRAPWLSLAHGLCLAALGAVLLVLGHGHFDWLVGALTGFLLLGPLVASSLYAISRALEQGAPVGWSLVAQTWMQWQRTRRSTPHYWCLVQFGALLALSAAGWMLVSASLITLLAPQRIHTPLEFLQHVVLAPDGQLFHLWLALGSVLAAPIFASSVVSMPLLLDRKVSLAQAVLTSWLVILENPVTMAVWAGLILMFSLLGMASLLLGMVFIVPMLGHASWHAYRDTVDASAFALREAAP